MRNVKQLLARLIKGEDGVTMIEYALLAALIALAAIVTITNVGTALNTKYDSINTKLQ
jgi:pilus assembly protein Flp/PilA